MAVFDNSGRKVETSVFGRPQILPHIEPKAAWSLGCGEVGVFDDEGRKVETKVLAAQLTPNLSTY